MTTPSKLVKKTVLSSWTAFIALTAAGFACANPNPDAPTVLELIQLPKGCQIQLGPQYQSAAQTQPKPQGQPAADDPVRRTCGVYMNHFCTALVYHNRAAKLEAPKDSRRYWARRARADMNYTVNNMLPTCVMKQEVQGADARLKVVEMFLK